MVPNDHCRNVTGVWVMSHNHYFFSAKRTFKILAPSNFQGRSRVLVAVITTYIRSPAFIHLITGREDGEVLRKGLPFEQECVVIKQINEAAPQLAAPQRLWGNTAALK